MDRLRTTEYRGKVSQQFLNALIQCYHLIPDVDHLKNKWQAVITPESLNELGKMVIEAAPAERREQYGDPLHEGFNNLCVSLDKVRSALEKHALQGRFLLAVGKTEWENMKWNDQSIAEKRNVINSVDLVFTAAPNPETYYAGRKKLSEANVNAALLDCSDAHALSTTNDKDRIGNCFSWIKAESTFGGLQQAVREFDQRVFVGDKPPKRLLVASNRTKYASAIKIKKKAGSTLADTWFDNEVPLNHDLVAIIGNKGSGKSALADAVALVGDTRNSESFSFLTDKRFRDPRNNLAMHFVGLLKWHDGTDSQRGLHENPASSSVERIKYLPQSYLETLCNELAGSGSSTFDGELRKIIYTHVPEEERIGFASLDDLLNFKVSELEAERKQLGEELSKVNSEIVAVEHRLAPGFRQSLELQLENKRKELAALEGSKPAPVEDPLASDSAKQETEAAAAKIAELENKLDVVQNEEQTARHKKTDALKGMAHVSRILQAIRNYQKGHEQFVIELGAMLADLNVEITPATVVSLKVDISSLEQRADEFKKESVAQDALLAGDGEDVLTKRRESLEAELKSIKGQLGEKQRLFLVYKEQLVQWQKAISDLHGDKSKNNTIAWYVGEIESLAVLPEKRKQLRLNREVIVGRLHLQIGKVVSEYRTLYQPVQGFVQSSARMELPLPLDFDVRIAEEGFQEEFLGRINRQVRGSFAGIDESNLLIRKALQETDFMNSESVVSFVDKIDDMLHFDRRPDGAAAAELFVPDQLRKGNVLEDIYDFLFGLEYLSPRYSLTYDGQEISQLSPGERGLLLLVFYLLVDKDDIPLVIDQPEENLDNQTIYKVLVTCIKTAKQHRQVIMVTHNPNLAVVCDAEQIIVASCDKANKCFTYVSGAIEAPEIKARVVEILEGTEPAFVNRKRKYGL